MQILIPMAGMGLRFKNAGFEVPKPLIKVKNKTLIEHSVETLNISGQYIFITRKYWNEYDCILSEILKKLSPDSIEIKIDYNTNGSVDSCLLSEPFLKKNDELITTNCDQYLKWNSSEFLHYMNSNQAAGGILTFTSTDPRHSFAKINQNRVIQIVEKKAISNCSLVGVHYFKKSKYFLYSGKKLKKIVKNKECYVSETYNLLIEKKLKIIYFNLKNGYYPLGVPEDLNNINEIV